MIGKNWIYDNVTDDGTVELLVAQGVADKIKRVAIYEIGSPAVKCEFDREESNDPHMDT